jgi:hypothetical protein
MKLFNYLVPFLGLFALVSAAPTEQETSLRKRDNVASASTIVSNLITSVKAQTAQISMSYPIWSQYGINISDLEINLDSTAASVTPSSSEAEKEAAGEAITSYIAAINAAVVDATNQVKALPTSSKRADLVVRQTASSLATLVEELLLEISGALNNVIASLGLTSTLSFLGPLVASLSGLLLSLEVVVNNLLALVQQLLDGLLTGLSLALAGLVL